MEKKPVLLALILFVAIHSAFSEKSFFETMTETQFAEITEKKYKPVSLDGFSDIFHHARYGFKDEIPDWKLYDKSQIAGIAENLLWLQNPDGGWAKNYDWQRKYSLLELKELHKKIQSVPVVTYGKKPRSSCSTLDNRNIYSQIVFLSAVYEQIPDVRYKDCAIKALEWIFNAQHPVSFGFTGSDVYALTFNDDITANTLSFLRDVSWGKYSNIFDAKVQKKSETAYKKGIDCILKSQIKINLNGKEVLTAWAQQYDHETLEPIWARTFEPPAITPMESVRIIIFLMEEKNPSEEIKQAVHAACAWIFSPEVIITGKKIVSYSGAAQILNGRYSDYENRMVDDASAEPLWARYYSIDGTYAPVNSPIWCDRDRKICSDYNEISLERRNGYGNAGTWPARLRKRYDKWKQNN